MMTIKLYNVRNKRIDKSKGCEIEQLMIHSKLSEYTFKKGEFITPMNSLSMMKEFEDEKSWTYGRMPEYLWIGLIFKCFGREEGLKN